MKLPKPQQLPSGSWRIHVQVGGKRVAKTFPTESEALYWAAGIKTEEKQDTPSGPKMTYENAAKKYIELNEPPVTSPSTYRELKSSVRNHFLGIQHKRLCDITKEDVQKEVNTMAKKLAPKTVRNHYYTFTAIYEYFAKTRIPDVNLPDKVKTDIEVPTEEHAAILIDHFRGTDMELPFLLLSALGLRDSELRFLEWKHIQGDIVKVRGASVRGEHTYESKSPKSYAGSRDLRMPKYMVDLIKKTPRKGDHVLSCGPRAVYRAFKKACQNLGLPDYRLHDLRHYFCSILMAENIPDGYAITMTGHSTTNMLRSVYQHKMAKREDEFSKTVAGYFDKALEKKGPETGKSVHENAHENPQPQ